MLAPRYDIARRVNQAMGKPTYGQNRMYDDNANAINR
jgi:hypothetical protein